MGGSRYGARRNLSVALLVTVLLAALTGCARGITGSPVAKVCSPANLMSCMLPVPVGSNGWQQPYAPNGQLTMTQFLDRVYFDQSASDKATIQSQLSSDGLRTIVHESWVSADGDFGDMLLYDFANATGASREHTDEITAFDGDTQYRRLDQSTLQSDGVATYQLTTNDSANQAATTSWGTFGPVLMEFFYWSPTTVDTQPLDDWLTTQVALLNPLRNGN